MSTPTREIPTGVAATILAIGCAGGLVATARAGSWWWILFVVLLLVTAASAYGAVESFQLRHRDEEGNPIA
ncbi:hypothetical protein [Nocardioides aquiterrae]